MPERKVRAGRAPRRGRRGDGRGAVLQPAHAGGHLPPLRSNCCGGEHPQHVVDHQNLTITGRPGTDADGDRVRERHQHDRQRRGEPDLESREVDAREPSLGRRLLRGPVRCPAEVTRASQSVANV